VFDHFQIGQTVTIVYYNLGDKVCIESIDGYHAGGPTGDLTTVGWEESKPFGFIIGGAGLLVIAVICLVGWGVARVVYRSRSGSKGGLH
jgi:hypothetical protein